MIKILDFWAPWCGPCKMMDPILEELEKEFPNVEVVKINVDEEGQKAQSMGVMSIPTYIVMKDEKEVGRRVGYTQKSELQKLFQS